MTAWTSFEMKKPHFPLETDREGNAEQQRMKKKILYFFEQNNYASLPYPFSLSLFLPSLALSFMPGGKINVLGINAYELTL